MDPIFNADRLVRLLRQRLAERSKAKPSQPTNPASELQNRGIESTKAITGNFARAGGSGKATRRTLIEQLLADQFGNELVNEPKFQELVERVAVTMEADPAVAEMLEQVTEELKAMPG
jgi:hypothetical protein